MDGDAHGVKDLEPCFADWCRSGREISSLPRIPSAASHLYACSHALPPDPLSWHSL